MNVYQILPRVYDVGPGQRVEVFVSFCTIKCNFCFNRLLWDKNQGHPFSEKDKNKIFEYLSDPMTEGITLVGGEPFMLVNQQPLYELCKEIREKFPNKDIWAYSGFEWETLKITNLAKILDAIVCGPYIQEYNDGKSIFKGSENQYIIDTKKSLAQNKRVYWLDFEGNPMGPGKYKPLEIKSDTELLNELIKAIKSNKATIGKDSSDYGKGLTAAYSNVLDYYEHLLKIKQMAAKSK